MTLMANQFKENKKDVVYMNNSNVAGLVTTNGSKFCTACGTQNAELANFCCGCGRSL